MKIAVLFGGISTERNVSIAGGKSVVEALRSKGHEVTALDPAFGYDPERSESELSDISAYPSQEELDQFHTKNYIECVNSPEWDDIEVAFIVLHGKNGEDGTIQALLQLRGIPYTGSDVKSSSFAIDKAATKTLIAAAGIPTPLWAVFHPEDIGNYDFYKEIRAELGSKIVVKPNDQGSTIGISIITNGHLDEIHDAVVKASALSHLVLVEQFIEGREITVGIVGEEALPVIEIIPEDGFYDYAHKYTKGHTEYVCPADISDDVAETAQNMAATAHRLIGCSGFSRVDFRLNEDNLPYCLEINTIPGFTSTSLVPKAAKEIGIEFPELCEQIIEIALKAKRK